MEHYNKCNIGRRIGAGRNIFLYLLFSLCIYTAYGQIPDCTQITNPVDGEANVPVTTFISWAAVPTATKYFVTIGSSPGGTDVLDNSDLGPDLNYTPPSGLLPNTTYYITIVPNNNTGDAIGCTEESFTTGDASAIPGCATLLSPLDGSYGVAPESNITWAPQAAAAGYLLTIGTSSGGTDILDNFDAGNVTTYNLPTDLPLFQRIYVTITPYNSAGDTASCSEVSFRTRGNNPPMCTEIIDPIDGGQFVSVTANITWIRDFNASGYRMTIWEKAIGGIKILDNEDVGTGTNYKPPDFMENTLYFVKITPYNDLGEANNCQPISFSTGIAPLPPDCTTLIIPADGSKNVETDAILTWNAVSGAAGYILSVGTTPGGSEIVVNENVAGLANYTFAELLPENTEIYVNIIPYGNNGPAENCGVESFTTLGPEVITENIPIPQFFTPNNDGFNDSWMVNSTDEVAITGVWIFNRYGQLLKQIGPGVGWDGNFNGKPLAADSYWYRIDTSNGNSIAGYFVLKR
ncbi:T9SS type B sorting domain-containing protein [Muriicola sp. Z0-33]|uniref:T9SS type B sorting domain-containing protein n=1 Tax=Muriicola sp. Z0-33 TaxID=2816957 RepID=UPI002237F313|nr:T9SS type B sorting domain-containing protein [Muriicola sp. Z0-33]MCW5515237.1 T9SS type B sorting domain-containing protein [Muriicola sp. Z0-33]